MLRRKVDVCVIGGGPAGIAAALRAVDFNKNVCIVEKNRIGGADLWDGALQSKTLWEMSKSVRVLNGKTAARLLDIQTLPPIDNNRIQQTLRSVSELKESQTLHQLKSAGVDVIEGRGSFKDPKSLLVEGAGDAATVIDADYFVIATGSKPRQHPLIKADQEIVVTSDKIMQQPIPKSMVVIGGGVIGCEFASIYANFGQTDVRMIEKSSRILPMEDEDVALYIQSLLQEKGVTFHHDSMLHAAEITPDQRVKYTLVNKEGAFSDFQVDKALISIGRQPLYEELNLSALGDVTVSKGKLKRDQYNRVKPFNHIYACGDATTDVALVNVGELEGRACIEHMYSVRPEEDIIRSTKMYSSILFLDQEVASVGLNEQQCQKNHIGYRMARYGYEFVSRAVAMNNTRGFVKLIVTNDRKMQVLGVRAVGAHASSIVDLASLAIHNKESAFKLADLLTAYPAVTQGFQECLRMLLGSSVLKPNVFPGLVLKEWSPSDFSRGRAYPDSK